MSPEIWSGLGAQNQQQCPWVRCRRGDIMKWGGGYFWGRKIAHNACYVLYVYSRCRLICSMSMSTFTLHYLNYCVTCFSFTPLVYLVCCIYSLPASFHNSVVDYNGVSNSTKRYQQDSPLALITWAVKIPFLSCRGLHRTTLIPGGVPGLTYHTGETSSLYAQRTADWRPH